MATCALKSLLSQQNNWQFRETADPCWADLSAAVSQVEPSDGAVVPFLPAGVSIFGHQSSDAGADPADVLGHPGVDAVFALACAAFTPAHDSGDKVGVAVARDVWPAAVTLAGILCYFVIAGTEHLGGDTQLGGFHAG